jgi:phage gp29-like protein
MSKSITERLQVVWDKLIPVKLRTVFYNHLNDVPSQASSLDVDELHAIIRAAENGDPRRLFALYRDVIMSDSHIQTEFAKRKIAVLGDPLSVQPFDKNNPDDVIAYNAIRLMLDNIDNKTSVLGAMMDGMLYPLSILEKVFTPSSLPGLRYELRDLVQVPYELLDYSQGKLQICDADPVTGSRLATMAVPDANRYMIHRGHLLSFPDNWGGPLRSLLFWWLFTAMDRDWWVRFLERFGAPFLKGKYDQNDDASRVILERAFSNAARMFGVVVSKETEVELVQAMASDGSTAYEKFFNTCQLEKSKLILGQTLSATAQPTGMNSGVSSGQEAVRGDFKQFDGMVLAETFRTQLFRQFLAINGLRGRAPRVTWGGESARESEATGKMLASIATAGLRVTDASLPVISERLGIEVERAPAPASALPFAADVVPMAAPVRYRVSAQRRRAEQVDAANNDIASGGAATLALAFRGSLAPVRRLILESTGPADLEQRIRTFYADWSPERVAPLIEEALTAYAANGTAVHDRN